MSMFSFFSSVFTFVSHKSVPFSIKTKLNMKPLDVSKEFITRGMIGSEWTYNDFVDNLQKKNIDAVTILSNQNTIVTVDKNYDDIKIIINAGVLDKKSKMRSEFEKSKNSSKFK